MTELERVKRDIIQLMEQYNRKYPDCDLNSYEMGCLAKELHLKYEIFDGASKMVFVPFNTNFVIKVAYGDWYNTLEVDEATLEAELYEGAKSKGIECFFPETYVAFTWNNLNFVYQKKYTASEYDRRNFHYHTRRNVPTVRSKVIHKAEEEYYKTQGEFGYFRDFHAGWWSLAISAHGKKRIKKLMEFIRLNQINDLHASNLGYCGNRPVIIDFSGYHRN